MGTVRKSQPVKLMASLLTGDVALLVEAKTALSPALGPIDFESELFPFDRGTSGGRGGGARTRR